MINNVCRKCGGSNFISDRSLGGKIVCSRCGSTSFKSNNFINSKNRNLLYLILLILVLLIIII